MTRDDHLDRPGDTDDADDADDADDDLRLGPLPAPDAAADPAERARARAFGDLVDKVLTGRTPAAVPAEDRALVEVATALRAVVRPVELAAGRQRSIVEAALATAIARRGGGTALRLTDPSITAAAGVTPLGRARWRRAAPWVVAGASLAVAAAAVAMLLVGHRPGPGPVARVEPSDAPRLPVHWRSRPADPLIGAIAREASGDALGRIETIYADRLAGYRERSLDQPRRHAPPGGRP